MCVRPRFPLLWARARDGSQCHWRLHEEAPGCHPRGCSRQQCAASGRPRGHLGVVSICSSPRVHCPRCPLPPAEVPSHHGPVSPQPLSWPLAPDRAAGCSWGHPSSGLLCLLCVPSCALPTPLLPALSHLPPSGPSCSGTPQSSPAPSSVFPVTMSSRHIRGIVSHPYETLWTPHPLPP